MGASERAISFVFALAGSMLVTLFVVTGNESILQGAADALLKRYIQDAALRFYLFDALIVGLFVVVGSLAIYGAKSNAMEDFESA